MKIFNHIKLSFFLFIFLLTSITSYATKAKTLYVYSVKNKRLPNKEYIGMNSISEALFWCEQNRISQEIRILLADGEHNIQQPIRLKDLTNPLKLEAENSGKAILTNYKTIPKEIIRSEKENVIIFPISSEVVTLQINDKYVPITCSIEQTNPAKFQQFSSFQQEAGNNVYSAIFNIDEIQKMEIGCYIYIYCKWIQYKLEVQHIDLANGRVLLKGMKVNVSYIKNNPEVYYSIYNSKKLLKPFTICCNSNKVFYHLGEKESLNQLQIKQPILSNLIHIVDCSKGISLKGIHFRGTTLEHLITSENQGKVNLTSSILVENSQHITIENCEFSENAGYSIKIGDNSCDCQIQNNYFHDLPGGGILIGNYQKADKTHNILVNNNLIKSFGRMNASCEGIMITKAHHITITNNTICDGYYTGISLGWTWGYGKSYSYGNYVANNHIHHLMQGVLSDGAGIYTLGKQEGTIIENNYIHDIVSRAFNAAGSSLLYFDEGTSNVIARNNVCFGSHSGFHEHYGKCNTVEDNVFAFTNLVAIRLSNEAKDSLLTIKNNKIAIDCGQDFNATIKKKAIIIDNDKISSTKNFDLNVDKLYKRKLIKHKFSYGVTSNSLKDKALLSTDYLNKHNQMVVKLFNPCSSYFHRIY